MARQLTKRERISRDILNAEQLGYQIRDIAFANQTTSKIIKEHIIYLKQKGMKIPKHLLLLIAFLLFGVDSFSQDMYGHYKIISMTGIEEEVRPVGDYQYYEPKNPSHIRFNTTGAGVEMLELKIGSTILHYEVTKRERNDYKKVDIKNNYMIYGVDLKLKDHDGIYLLAFWFELSSLDGTRQVPDLLQMVYVDEYGNPVQVYVFEAVKL